MQTSSAARVCTLRLKGHLDVCWSDWYEEVSITHDLDGTTGLTLHLPDQSALMGMLIRLHNFGFEIISLDIQTHTFCNESANDTEG